MGDQKRDRDAVVDHRLRVHGIKNLRVADASIMPTIVGANTNAPTIMIGEKAADMILQDASSRSDRPRAQGKDKKKGKEEL